MITTLCLDQAASFPLARLYCYFQLAEKYWCRKPDLRLVHGSLWVLLLAVPVTAFLALGSETHPLTLLGGVRVEQMTLIANSALANLADWGDVHGFLGDSIMALAGLHAAAAIFHQVVLKDGVLAAMLARGKAG
jgi:cytochrome b561